MPLPPTGRDEFIAQNVNMIRVSMGIIHMGMLSSNLDVEGRAKLQRRSTRWERGGKQWRQKFRGGEIERGREGEREGERE